MSDQFTEEQPRNQIDFGFVTIWVLSLAGVPPHMAARFPNDIEFLKNTGYQLLAIWIFITLLQGFTYSTVLEGSFFGPASDIGEGTSESLIRGNHIVGFSLAMIVATLIIGLERSFLSQDYFLEGKIHTLEFLNPGDPLIGALKRKRLSNLLLRAVPALGIAYAIAHFMVPVIYKPEIFRDMKNYECQIEENQLICEEKQDAAGRSVAKRNATNDLIIQSTREIAQRQEDLDLLEAQKVQLVQGAELNSEISALESDIRYLEERSDLLDICYQAEVIGRNPTELTAQCRKVSGGLVLSGVKGCPPVNSNCAMFKSQSNNATRTIQRQKQEIIGLRNQYARDVNEIDVEIAKAKQQIAYRNESLQELKGEYSGFGDIEQKDREGLASLAEDIGFSAIASMAGIADRYQSYDRLRQDWSSTTKSTDFALKVLIVFLEMLVLISRIAGMTPGYSSMVYARHQKQMESMTA